MKTPSLRRAVTIAAIAVAGIAIASVFGAWTTYDYGLDCTKCLHSRHVIVQRFLGVPFFRTTTQKPGRAEYAELFKRPCKHVLRRGGFGRSGPSLFGASIGCGITGEGAFVAPRLEAVRATYHLYGIYGDEALALETFRLIDEVFPPKSRRTSDFTANSTASSTLWYLRIYLDRVRSISEWQEVVECARDGFNREPKVSPWSPVQPTPPASP